MMSLERKKVLIGAEEKKTSKYTDYRGRLVKYLPDGQVGIVTEACWFHPSIKNHYIIVLCDGTKRTVSINDESSLVELI